MIGSALTLFGRLSQMSGRDTHAFTRASLVLELTVVKSSNEAMAAATGLIDAAEATRNPRTLSYALLA